jgi:hypothetical protein
MHRDPAVLHWILFVGWCRISSSVLEASLLLFYAVADRKVKELFAEYFIVEEATFGEGAVC